jgi:hypothetical protein
VGDGISWVFLAGFFDVMAARARRETWRATTQHRNYKHSKDLFSIVHLVLINKTVNIDNTVKTVHAGHTKRGGDPHMVKLAATALRGALSETINRVAYQGERVMLERHGKAVAAIVSAEDLWNCSRHLKSVPILQPSAVH